MAKYDLVGVNGNAFAVMGYVANAMRENGYTRNQVEDYYADAKSADYSHLIRVSVRMIDEINDKTE